jgi:hypothetical protein
MLHLQGRRLVVWYSVWRRFRTFYDRKDLPVDVTEPGGLEFARDYARENGFTGITLRSDTERRRYDEETARRRL